MVAGLARYRSFQDHRLLGRWSPAFAVSLTVLLLACLVSLGISWVHRGDRAARKEWRHWFGAGSFLIGLGYLVGTVSGDEPGRLLTAALFTTSSPLAAFLGWLGGGAIIAAILGALLPHLKGQVARSIASVVFGLLAFLWLAEGAARLATFLWPETQGYPTISQQIWLNRHVHRNSLGFRGPEPAGMGARPNTHKVALIGDSFALGLGVPEESGRLGEILATELPAACRAGEWDALNFAQLGTNTLDHAAFVRTALKYHPDLMILEYVFNDIDYLAPTYTHEGPVDAAPTLRERVAPRRLLFHNSFLFQQLFVRWLAVTYQGGVERPAIDPYMVDSLLSLHLKDVRMLSDEATAAGVPFVVIPVELGTLVDSAVQRRYDRVVNAMQTAGIHALSQDSVLKGMTASSLFVNRLDAHPNARANQLLASGLAPSLCQFLGQSLGIPAVR